MAADPQTRERTILAFDFGTRKIGVAVGNTLIRIAHPLATIDAATLPLRLDAIAQLIAQWQPETLLVGRPVHADGTPHRMTEASDRFARELARHFNLTVDRADERYSTRAATTALAEMAGTRAATRKAARDAVAAQLILQAWFDRASQNDDPYAPA